MTAKRCGVCYDTLYLPFTMDKAFRPCSCKDGVCLPCLVNCFSMADDMCPFCHKVRLRTSMLRRALSKDPGKLIDLDRWAAIVARRQKVRDKLVRTLRRAVEARELSRGGGLHPDYAALDGLGDAEQRLEETVGVDDVADSSEDEPDPEGDKELDAQQRNAPADGETLAVLRQLEEQRRKQRDEDARKEEEETMRVLSDKDREEALAAEKRIRDQRALEARDRKMAEQYAAGKTGAVPPSRPSSRYDDGSIPVAVPIHDEVLPIDYSDDELEEGNGGAGNDAVKSAPISVGGGAGAAVGAAAPATRDAAAAMPDTSRVPANWSAGSTESIARPARAAPANTVKRPGEQRLVIQRQKKLADFAMISSPASRVEASTAPSGRASVENGDVSRRSAEVDTPAARKRPRESSVDECSVFGLSAGAGAGADPQRASKAPRPYTDDEAAPAGALRWVCSGCTGWNTTDKHKCGMCGVARASDAQEFDPEAAWRCAHCTFAENRGTAPPHVCEVCGTPRFPQ